MIQLWSFHLRVVTCLPSKNAFLYFFLFQGWEANKFTRGAVHFSTVTSTYNLSTSWSMALKEALLKRFSKLSPWWLTQSHAASQHKSQMAAKCFWSSATWQGETIYNPAHNLVPRWNECLVMGKKRKNLFCLSSPSCSWVEMRRCRQPAPSASQPPWFSHLVEPAPPSSRPTSPVMMVHLTRALQRLRTSAKSFMSPTNNFPRCCPFLLLIPLLFFVSHAMSFIFFSSFAAFSSSFIFITFLLLFISLPLYLKTSRRENCSLACFFLLSHTNVSLASCNFYYSFLRVSLRPSGRHWERGAAVVRLQLFTVADSGRPLLLTVSLSLRWERSDSSKHLQATYDLF